MFVEYNFWITAVSAFVTKCSIYQKQFFSETSLKLLKNWKTASSVEAESRNLILCPSLLVDKNYCYVETVVEC